ncbi:MAG TPA: OFA family MFS transporter [Candidatus Hydrogenedentes bacterium]|nr:OFA family MFS transporter [Candidatus Hydrogenedentota bacterium]HRT20524.1 OFA family MFS transporter [Candidatus Hydrogenedentota bacterium]HRT65271.1 OFA family MFS transporter [Candidatus Hydrogenedentota bacterium]
MSEQPAMNRWIVVAGAILIQLCLGAIYAWSVFAKPLSAPDGGYGFTNTQTQIIFSAGLAVFAVVMVIAGRLQAKTGPRPIAMLGGIVLGIGYILGGLFGKTYLAQLICIGFIGGAGIGLGYVVPIAVGVKWFPDKKGLITGLSVAGFGFGATLWVKLAGGFKTILWLVPANYAGLIKTTSLMGLPGVQSVFLLYGIVFLVCVVLGSLVMINPPAGYKPKGWTPPPATAAASGALDMTSGEMLGTPQFYLLWLTFMGSAMAGLMVIGCISLFGTDALLASGAADKDQVAVITGTAMALLAIFNGMGRIIWGSVSDKIGRKPSIFLMCLLQGVIMLAFYKIGGSTMGLIAGACIIGFNFGGNFALFPAATADFFGNKNVGLNYGWVFLAYGVAGICGPFIAGYFTDAAKAAAAAAASPELALAAKLAAWKMPMLIAAAGCFAGAVLSALVKPPKAKA